jgi:hypothetical protein
LNAITRTERETLDWTAEGKTGYFAVTALEPVDSGRDAEEDAA